MCLETFKCTTRDMVCDVDSFLVTMASRLQGSLLFRAHCLFPTPMPFIETPNENLISPLLGRRFCRDPTHTLPLSLVLSLSHYRIYSLLRCRFSAFSEGV